jgi:hypothetical protein
MSTPDFSDALIDAFGSTYINFAKQLPLRFGGSSQLTIMASVFIASLDQDAWLAHKDSVLNFGTLGGNRLYASIGGAEKNIQGHPVLQAEDWFQVALVYDGNALKIYLDGKEDASGTGWPEANNAAPLLVGLDLQTRYPAPQLQVSRLGIWNRALTPAEVGAVHALEKRI